jgi:hypothetical protein
MTNFIRCFVLAGSLLLIGVVTPRAYGDSFILNWTGAYGPGSAVLTATPNGVGMFLVTAMNTAVQNGLPITLLPPNVYGANDNEIYQPPNTNLLDLAGLGFSDGTNDYNLFLYTIPADGNTYTECSSAVTGTTGCLTTSDFDRSQPVNTLTITPLAGTPEPASVALCGAAFLGAIILRRRKTRQLDLWALLHPENFAGAKYRITFWRPIRNRNQGPFGFAEAYRHRPSQAEFWESETLRSW